MKKDIRIILSLLLYTIGIQAEIRLPGISSDKMVLQRDIPIPLWGFVGLKEAVVIEFNGKQYKTRASQTREWTVNLQKHKAGGPHGLRVSQKIIQDVYVGDVYLCSGQSNTEPTIKCAMDRCRDEIMSYENNLIRYTKTSYVYSSIEPQQDSNNEWKICIRENTLDFAALCYFLAKEMQVEKGVTIGIINGSWGGTNIASWFTHQSLEEYARFREKLQSPQYFHPNYPDSVKNAQREQVNQWHR